jgi:hypothetical protein
MRGGIGKNAGNRSQRTIDGKGQTKRKGGESMITYDSLFLMLQFGMLLIAMFNLIEKSNGKNTRK